MVMTMFCYLCIAFFARLLKRGVTVSETDPNKGLLIRPRMFLSGKRKMLSSNKALFSPPPPQETHLFKDWPVNLQIHISALSVQTPSPCRSLPKKWESYQLLFVVGWE